jgi:hypothetical protein
MTKVEEQNVVEVNKLYEILKRYFNALRLNIQEKEQKHD